MKLIFCISLSMLTCCAFSQTSPVLEPYLSKKQVFIILTPTAYHPKFEKQLKELEKIQYLLTDKDLFIIKNHKGSVIFAEERHLSKAENRHLYQHFGVTPKTFAIIFIDKEGHEIVRTTDVVSCEKLKNTVEAINTKMGFIENKNNK